MTAFNKTNLENTFLTEQAKILLDKKLISNTTFESIKSELTPLNTNSLLIRLGFFILGCFLISSFAGMISMVAMSISEKAFSVLFFICGILAFIVSELTAHEGLYKHGLNDAFILSTIVFLVSGTEAATNFTTLMIFTVIVSGIWCAVRYIHTPSTIVTFIACIAFVADLVINHNLADKMFLPFIGLALGFIFYFSNRILSKNERFEFYRNSFRAIKICSLVLIYLSMNYLVVRELSVKLLHIVIKEGDDIALAPLFYTTTFVIPIIYIILGIKQKDRISLNLGLLAFGFSFYSIRHYYDIIALEAELSIEGILLFIFSFLAFSKLKEKTVGLTFQPDRGEDSSFVQNSQAFLSIVLPEKHQPDLQESKMPFGGGNFSGGGAGSEY